MSEHTEFYVNFFTKWHQSDKQYAGTDISAELTEEEALQQAWNELQDVPSYVERYEEI